MERPVTRSKCVELAPRKMVAIHRPRQSTPAPNAPSQPGIEPSAIRNTRKDMVKRALDLVLASIAAVIFLPSILLIAFVITRDGGPAFFAHTRIGRGGVPFRCLKFRTMVVNADAVLRDLLERDPAARAEWERDFKLRHDPRITRIGRFLRETSLDELPQLLNVLRGEMSLVGPRPITAEEVQKYGDLIHHYYSCRPGITGLWQVNGRSNTSYERRVSLDAEYSSTASLFGDLVILARTVEVVVRRTGAH